MSGALHEIGAWALVLVFMAVAAGSLTEALAIVNPDLTTRQRWAVMFWLGSAVGAVMLAWDVG